MMKKTGLGFSVCLLLGACVQDPVPVVSGYQKQGQPTLRRMADGEAPRLLQPAEAEAPQKIGGVPVMQVSKVEDLPPPQRQAAFNVEPAAGPVEKTNEVAASTPAPKVVEHTVAGGDSLYKIAGQYNTTVHDIMKKNGLSSPAIQVGQVLKIDVGAKEPSAWQEMRQMLAGKEPAKTPVKTAQQVAQSKPEPQQTAAAPDIHWVMHKVQAKETIYRISRAYNVSILDIMAANDFEKPQDLKYGTEVRIPVLQTNLAARQDADMAKMEPASGDGRENDRRLAMLDMKGFQGGSLAKEAEMVVTPVKAKEEPKRGQVDPVANKAKGLVWPVKGEILRKFGDAGSGVAYTGINIAVPMGTPVLASEAGTVLYADDGLKIYGKLVLLRHKNGMVSAYAHNSRLLVDKGEHVKKGQIIATSGASGNVGKPQLHFELRRHASAIDPMRVLPKL